MSICTHQSGTYLNFMRKKKEKRKKEREWNPPVHWGMKALLSQSSFIPVHLLGKDLSILLFRVLDRVRLYVCENSTHSVLFRWTLTQLRDVFSASDLILISILFDYTFFSSRRNSWMQRNWPWLKTFEVKLLGWSRLLRTGLRVKGVTSNQSFHSL